MSTVRPGTEARGRDDGPWVAIGGWPWVVVEIPRRSLVRLEAMNTAITLRVVVLYYAVSILRPDLC